MINPYKHLTDYYESELLHQTEKVSKCLVYGNYTKHLINHSTRVVICDEILDQLYHYFPSKEHQYTKSELDEIIIVMNKDFEDIDTEKHKYEHQAYLELSASIQSMINKV